MKHFFSTLLILAAFVLSAAPAVRFTKGGKLLADGVEFELQMRDTNWKTYTLSESYGMLKAVKESADNLVVELFSESNASGTIDFKLVSTGKDRWQLTADGKFNGKFKCNFLGFAIAAPISDFRNASMETNGKKVKFPARLKKPTIISGNADSFALPGKSGRIDFTGKTAIHLQDNRQWNANTFGFRFAVMPGKGSFETASLDLAIAVKKEFSLGKTFRPEYIIKAGKEYSKAVNALDVKKGSVLDFSHRLDAPAGKYGRVTVKNGRFVFEKKPDTPVTFYGTNLVGTSQIDTKEHCEKLAKRLAAFGFNCIRIHHHDNEICDRKDTRKLDADLTDKLDYLIYCIKQEGMYITTDTYVSRRNFTKVELPEYAPIASPREFKALFWIEDKVFENWKTAALNFLTHKNPYTGMSLLEDPALITLSLINEGNPSSVWNASRRTTKLYNKKFAEYKKSNPKAGMQDFLNHLAVKRFYEMKKVIRDLGCNVPLSDQNYMHWIDLAPQRAHYDYVDNHSYWDHPKFAGKAWSLPIIPKQSDPLATFNNVPAQLFPTRIFGKPFTVTEVDYAAPNIHRLHGTALLAGYAAFQQWDGIFQFAYSHSCKRNFNPDSVDHFFDLCTDPGKALSHRMGCAIFLHGGIKSAPQTVALKSSKNRREAWDSRCSALGFVARIGSDEGKSDEKFDIVLREKDITKDLNKNINSRKILRDGWLANSGLLYWTPQLRFSVADRSFRIDAPGAEVISLYPGTKLAGKILSVKNATTQTTIGIIPHDTTTLAKAKRIALFHFTDIQSEGRHYRNNSCEFLYSWGKAPHLVKNGSADISLKLPAGNWKVYQLNHDGSRAGEIAVTKAKDNTISFKHRVQDGMVCELAKE